MKLFIALSSALLLCLCHGMAQQSRFVSVTSTPSTSGVIQVLEGETAEVVTCQVTNGNSLQCNIQKDGMTFTGVPRGYPIFSNNYGSPQGTTICGPATISTIPTSNLNISQMLLTVKITPAAYDVNKTVMIAPGTNQVQVTLESSTNLLLWAAATNGVYGSPDTARFFRIRLNNLPTP